MKKILATAAVLAFAGSAFAGSFAVTASVDTAFGNVAGSQGGNLSWDGTATLLDAQAPSFNPGLAGVFPHSGFRIATPDGGFGNNLGSHTVAPGSVFTPNMFGGTWGIAVAGGTPSAAIDVDGSEFQAVMIAVFQDTLSNFSIAEGDQGANIRIQIDGVVNFVNFDDMNDNGYQLVFNPVGDGYNGLFVALIPTPGAAGLLGLAGLAAVRRRR